MPESKARLNRENMTIRHMIGIYCRGHHASGKVLCRECRELLDYALQRIEKCPYGEGKPTCAKCPVHCYKPVVRGQIRQVMRYAGPRMMLHHPVLALLHIADELKRPREAGLPRK